MRLPVAHQRGLSLIAWLVVGLAICFAWGVSSANQSRAAFEQDTRILHRVLSQRAEQHEAVLSSLVALERSRVNASTFADFAKAMRARYAQIEVIEYCTSGGTAAPVCTALAGSRSGLEQNLESQAFVAALATRPNQPLAVTTWSGHDRFGLSKTASQGVFVLWIDAVGFVAPNEFPHTDARLELSSDGGATTLFKLEPREQITAFEATLLPKVQLLKSLGSASQPFILRADRQVRFRELPVAWMIAFLVLGAVLTLLLSRLLFWTQQARLERAQAEAALGRERARAEGTVQAVSEALVACDRQGKITLVNPAAQALIGADATALLGQPLGMVVRLQATLTGAPLGAFLETFWRQPQPMDLPEGTTLLDRQQQARLVEGSLSPLHDEHGQLDGAVLACRDLGPFRKRMLEALEKSEGRVREHEAMLAHVGRVSTLSEIAAGIAHELNQPLTAILSHSQASLRLLENVQSNLPQVRRSLQANADQARRASQILERLRAQVARAPLQRDRIDLRQLVENVCVLTEHELRERGIDLEQRFDPETLEVEGDAIQLEQVLHNLLRNAVEAVAGLPVGRQVIQILGRRTASAVQLEVRDFGPGIAPEVLPELFTPFVTSKPAGLGLGLSLSQTLVQGMGGSLAGENASDGGARFTVSLPMLQPAKRPGIAHVES